MKQIDIPRFTAVSMRLWLISEEDLVKRTHLLWLSMIVLFLALTACERPAPRTDDAATTDPNTAPTVDGPAATLPPVGTEAAPEATATPDPAAATPGSGEATAVPAAEVTPTTGERIHVVESGDTLTQLAVIYGVPVEEIAAANGLSDVDTLEVGQEIIIPVPGSVDLTPAPEATTAAAEPTAAPSEARVHIVQQGENLFRIGLQYGFTVDELATYNGITDPNRIDVGQAIQIPPSN